MSVSSDHERNGSCLCRKVTFRTTGPDINCLVCHCVNCQRNSGSPYAVKAWFPDKRFKFTSGEDLLKQHDDSDTDTGGIVNRWFCSNCGSHVLVRSFRVPGVAIVNVGLFDKAWDWRIDYEQWRKSRLNFVEDVMGVSDDCKYDSSPHMREFDRVRAKL